jgi:5-methylcytosine-specific restriction endonuclease McrBC regulatory subunit McrC
MDYAEFFERYVQYVLSDVAKKKGAVGINNPHFSIRPNHGPAWGLNHLEPDLILQKGLDQMVVDAKYKSHIFNWDEKSDDLKDAFRHDFHQILAYCSLNLMKTKQAMLVYPFSNFTNHKIKINSPLTHSEIEIFLVGIPLEKSRIEEVKDELSKIIFSTC